MLEALGKKMGWFCLEPFKTDPDEAWRLHDIDDMNPDPVEFVGRSPHDVVLKAYEAMLPKKERA
jgi:hypothetical protein